MSSRASATGVVLLGTALTPLFVFSAAAASLVTLRQGPAEGGLLLLWALLPALGLLFFAQQPVQLLTVTSTVLLAMVLRITASWTAVLLGLILLGFISGLMVERLSPGLPIKEADAALWLETLNLEGLEQIDRRQLLAGLMQMSLGVYATLLTFLMVGGLALGRWWQSLLYNPGGFGREFQQLRLPLSLALGLALLIGLGWSTGSGAVIGWTLLLTVPLAIAGLALLHGLATRYGWGWPMLAGFYLLLLLMFQFVYPLLAGVALLDSIINFRGRGQMPGPPDETNQRT